MPPRWGFQGEPTKGNREFRELLFRQLPKDLQEVLQIYLKDGKPFQELYDQESANELGHFTEGYRRFLDCGQPWCDALGYKRPWIRSKLIEETVQPMAGFGLRLHDDFYT